jgi:hypothetical protein
MADYWLKQHEKAEPIGPYGGNLIKSFAAEKRIGPDWLVSSDQKSWQRAGSVKGLFTQTPPTTSKASPKDGPAIAAVLLEGIQFPMEALLAQIQQDPIPGQTAPETNGGNLIFNVGDAIVAVAPMPAPYPARDLAGPCATAWMWPKGTSAMSVKDHRSHVLVTVIGGTLAPIPRRLLLTRITIVMCSLAWTLKAWMGLCLPVNPGLHQQRHQQQKDQIVKMESKKFLNTLMRLPGQTDPAGSARPCQPNFRSVSTNTWSLCNFSACSTIPSLCRWLYQSSAPVRMAVATNQLSGGETRSLMIKSSATDEICSAGTWMIRNERNPKTWSITSCGSAVLLPERSNALAAAVLRNSARSMSGAKASTFRARIASATGLARPDRSKSLPPTTRRSGKNAGHHDRAVWNDLAH